MAAAESQLVALCSVDSRAREVTKMAMRSMTLEMLRETKELDLDWFCSYAFTPEVSLA